MAKYGLSDLVMTADLPYARTFTFKRDEVFIDWNLYEVHLQMRNRVNGALLIELTAFLVVDVDPTKLILSVDASFTQYLASEGKWDILAVKISDPNDSFRTPRPAGRVLVLQGVTRVA